MKIGDFVPDGDAPRYFGVYPAIVTDIVDPDSLGRIEVKFPWLGGDRRRRARLGDAAAPRTRTTIRARVLPAVDTQVVVAFEAGDLRRPYIVGACWNGRESLPEPPAAANNKRLMKTRAGSLLEFDDTDGAAKVTLSMQSGHKLVLDDAAQEVKLTHANGCVITFNAAGQIQIQANTTVEITASAVNVHAPTATFDGIINCTTLICSARRRVAVVHAGRGEHMVRRRSIGWLLVGPWYRWQRPGVPSSGRDSAPGVPEVRHRRAWSTEFLKDPQHSLKFVDEDLVHAGRRSAPALQIPSVHRAAAASAITSTSHGDVRKLFLDTHKRFYLVVCELHCDAPGLPVRRARRGLRGRLRRAARSRRRDLAGGPRGRRGRS